MFKSNAVHGTHPGTKHQVKIAAPQKSSNNNCPETFNNLSITAQNVGNSATASGNTSWLLPDPSRTCSAAAFESSTSALPLDWIVVLPLSEVGLLPMIRLCLVDSAHESTPHLLALYLLCRWTAHCWNFEMYVPVLSSPTAPRPRHFLS